MDLYIEREENESMEQAGERVLKELLWLAEDFRLEIERAISDNESYDLGGVIDSFHSISLKFILDD
jgi:hypothetical protein